MKAIEVVTLLADQNTDFFNALDAYCKQEDVIGLMVIMKTDYSRSIFLSNSNGSAIIKGKKVTKQPIQILKVDGDMYRDVIHNYYYDNDWMSVFPETQEENQESNDSPTLNTQETRQGACKVEINQETGVISIYTNVI